MKKEKPFTHLFVDIGGVLLTNGWDHQARKRAAKHFNLKWVEVESRHKVVFESYEEGKFTLEEYLNLVFFNQKRPFTRTQFKNFMFSQSKPYIKMLELIRELKIKHSLKVVVVSNEAREVNEYRIQKFKLNDFVDSFISSCFVKTRKPDPEIFRLALDISQAKIENVLYIENTGMFIEIAESLGIKSLLHKDYISTKKELISLFQI